MSKQQRPDTSEGWLPSWVRSWAQDSGLLLISQLFTVIMTSTLAVLIARSLGPAEWGVFSALLGLSLAFSAFVGLGVATWLLRELSSLWAREGSPGEDTRREVGRLLGGTLTINALLGGALVLAAFGATRIAGWGPDRSLALVGLTAYAALLATTNGLETVFRARRELRLVVLATFLEKSVLLGLIALFLLGGVSHAGIAVGYVVAGTGRLAFSGISVMLAGIRPSAPSLRTAWQLAKRSLPFALNTTSLYTIPRLDVFLIAALSAFSAGYFAIGDRIVGPALLVAASASSALYPFLARKQAGAGSWKAAALLGLVGALLAAGGIAMAPLLVPAIFGEAFAEAVPTVQVMLLILPFNFFASGIIAWLYSSGLERRVLLVTAVGGIAGTGAIVAGHALAGAAGAGGGYLFRQAFFAVALAALAFSHERETRVRLRMSQADQSVALPEQKAA
ncbi:MAG: oligosaccharide flippase family protein [Chloroflexi bacterium]|nr:oligosaccharide flippase family protein [Chloroflexota bacterium]